MTIQTVIIGLKATRLYILKVTRPYIYILIPGYYSILFIHLRNHNKVISTSQLIGLGNE